MQGTKFWDFYSTVVRATINRKKNAAQMGTELRRKWEFAKQLKAKEVLRLDDAYYQLIPVRTHIITPEENLQQALIQYVSPLRQPGDIVAISESILAITQGRAQRWEDIRCGILSRLLAPWVSNVTFGVGIGSPQSMQVAIQEVGRFKILYATMASFFGKLRGRRGDFYRIVGQQVKMIDVRRDYPIPFKGSRNYVVKAPVNVIETCELLSAALGCGIAVVDVNDIGANVLAGRNMGSLGEEQVAKLLRGNPAGQGGQCTPFVIIRKIRNPFRESKYYRSGIPADDVGQD